MLSGTRLAGSFRVSRPRTRRRSMLVIPLSANNRPRSPVTSPGDLRPASRIAPSPTYEATVGSSLVDKPKAKKAGDKAKALERDRLRRRSANNSDLRLLAAPVVVLPLPRRPSRVELPLSLGPPACELPFPCPPTLVQLATARRRRRRRSGSRPGVFVVTFPEIGAAFLTFHDAFRK